MKPVATSAPDADPDPEAELRRLLRELFRLMTGDQLETGAPLPRDVERWIELCLGAMLARARARAGEPSHRMAAVIADLRARLDAMRRETAEQLGRRAALYRALQKLKSVDERAGIAIELRLFAGLTVADVAGALGVAQRTIERELALGMAWLRKELGHDA